LIHLAEVRMAIHVILPRTFVVVDVSIQSIHYIFLASSDGGGWHSDRANLSQADGSIELVLDFVRDVNARDDVRNPGSAQNFRELTIGGPAISRRCHS
jgi:hypothetical protein